MLLMFFVFWFRAVSRVGFGRSLMKASSRIRALTAEFMNKQPSFLILAVLISLMLPLNVPSNEEFAFRGLFT